MGMKPLRCLIGLHEWKVWHLVPLNALPGEYTVFCERCGKQVTLQDAPSRRRKRLRDLGPQQQHASALSPIPAAPEPSEAEKVERVREAVKQALAEIGFMDPEWKGSDADADKVARAAVAAAGGE